LTQTAVEPPAQRRMFIFDSAEIAAPNVGGYKKIAKSLGILAVDAHAVRRTGFQRNLYSVVENWDGDSDKDL
jgi:hypothetical protein